MKRRRFISLAGTGAIATFSIQSFSQIANRKSKWQPDGVGSLARIGLLTPDFDPVPESEMYAMTPQGVSIHTSRVILDHGPLSFAEPPNVDNATELLTGLNPRVILYGFTSSSYLLGVEEDEHLRTRLEKRSHGIPVILTCQAATEAFRVLGAHNVALIHPPWFSDEVNRKAKDYFMGLGFEVGFCAKMTPSRTFTEVTPAEVYKWVKTNIPRETDAIFIGGNGLRAVGAISSLEQNLRKPVLTANQVLLWAALRLIGANSQVTNYGTVFTKS